MVYEQKNQAKGNCQINDRNYGEAFEARSKCFAPVPNHPPRRAWRTSRILYGKYKVPLIRLTKTVYAKSNTVDRSKKQERDEKNELINNNLYIHFYVFTKFKISYSKFLSLLKKNGI